MSDSGSHPTLAALRLISPFPLTKDSRKLKYIKICIPQQFDYVVISVLLFLEPIQDNFNLVFHIINDIS